MSEEQVKVLRGFNNGGEFVAPGVTIPVTSVRAQELELNGLVERGAAAKSAPVPDNKMASEPTNKAKPEPKTKAPKA